MTPPVAVGFVGLGNQGAPIAARIIDAGFPLQVWARRHEAYAGLLERGAVAAPDLHTLGAACSVVGVCVTADADVIEVVLGEGAGIAHAMRADGVIAIHSTVSPDTVVELAATTAAMGLHLLDAPVSGGASGATAGTMTTMVGGDASALEVARPVFDAFSSVVALLGPVGSGQRMKLLNNNLCYANVAMAISALEIAENLGMDPEVAAEVIAVSSGNSTGLRILTDPTLFAKASGPTSNVAKDVAHFQAMVTAQGLAEHPMVGAASTAAAGLATLAAARAGDTGGATHGRSTS